MHITRLLQDSRERLEEIASAVEDLIYMEAIHVHGKNSSAARISPELAKIISDLNSKTTTQVDTSRSEAERTMNLMYYGLLIFMTERLRLPKSFTVALGNDLETHREDMQTGNLMSTYVQVLAQISSSASAPYSGEESQGGSAPDG
jgi:hypothetical protein